MKKLDKWFSMIILVFILIIFGFLLGFNTEQNNQLKITKLNIFSIDSSDRQITDYNFDSISTSSGICTINGWALIKGVNSIDVTPTLILVDDENNFYKVKTKISQRRDVTAKINDGITYDNSGIEAKFNVEGLNKDKKYTVFLQVEINKIIYTKLTDVQLSVQ